MKVLEYVKKTNVSEFTFIKARARKDANTPFYHAEYQTTPMYHRFEVTGTKFLSNYIILNDHQEAIEWLSGAGWNSKIRSGWARCLLVISPEDLKTLVPNAEQRKSLVEFIDKKLKP